MPARRHVADGYRKTRGVTPRKSNASRQPANILHPERWRSAGDDGVRRDREKCENDHAKAARCAERVSKVCIMPVRPVADNSARKFAPVTASFAIAASNVLPA